MLGDEKTELLAAQVEDQAQQLPDLEEALRLAQKGANEQRASVGRWFAAESMIKSDCSHNERIS